MGTAFPEREQGQNLGRIAGLRAGLPCSVPGMTANRFCASGLQTVVQASHSIMVGQAEIMLAGGVESTSFIPLNASQRLTPNPTLASDYPDVYLSMGLTAENVAQQHHITRQEADAFAWQSHQRAIAAIDQGRFKQEIVPFRLTGKIEDGKGGFTEQDAMFDEDEGPRRDTSLEKLAQLRPVFKKGGTITAGNSSQTSDGAAAVLLMSSEKAQALSLTPQAIFRGYALAGVKPEMMGIGPVVAIPKLLKQTGVSLADIELIELNEAFAAQSLAVIHELGLRQEKVNVNGGAIALGHPFGCTGTKLLLTLIHELKRRGGGLGMVTMCVAGGIGAAGLFEVPGT